jgi:hypothetical protein
MTSKKSKKIPKNAVAADAKIIDPKMSAEMTNIAESVFRANAASMRKDIERQDNRLTAITIGGIVVGAALLITLYYTTYQFMAGYQKNFFDAESTMSGQMNDTLREIRATRDSEATDRISAGKAYDDRMNQLENRVSYLEGIIKK